MRFVPLVGAVLLLGTAQSNAQALDPTFCLTEEAANQRGQAYENDPLGSHVFPPECSRELEVWLYDPIRIVTRGQVFWGPNGGYQVVGITDRSDGVIDGWGFIELSATRQRPA
jgi:hypothetical protein